jgi:hypothetical protein
VLGEDLVGAADARRDARAGVRDPEQLEQLLDRAVLAVAAVQRDERDVGRGVAQRGDEVVPDVDRDDVVAQALERVLDPRARLQRDAALERPAALEDGDRLIAAARRAGAAAAPAAGGSGGRRRRGRAAPARRPGAAPVSVPYSATCSRTTSPMRRTPSRMSSSPTPEKFSRTPTRRGRRGRPPGPARRRRAPAGRGRGGRSCR